MSVNALKEQSSLSEVNYKHADVEAYNFIIIIIINEFHREQVLKKTSGPLNLG